MLLFRAGGEQKLAVPLGLVARLEDIPRDKIETSCGALVTQYRGKLMPLVALSDNLDTEKPRQSVLVFNDDDRTMGLMVDEIVDVVEDRLPSNCRARDGIARFRGDRRPRHRRDRHRLLVDAGIAGLVPRRRTVGEQ